MTDNQSRQHTHCKPCSSENNIKSLKNRFLELIYQHVRFYLIEEIKISEFNSFMSYMIHYTMQLCQLHLTFCFSVYSFCPK